MPTPVRTSPWLAFVLGAASASAVAATLFYSSHRPERLANAGPHALLRVAWRPTSTQVGSPTTDVDPEAFRRVQVALVKSPVVLNAAVRHPSARAAIPAGGDPVAWLAEHLVVSYADGSEVLRIGVTGLDASGAAAAANAVANAYLLEGRQRDSQLGRARLVQLEAVVEPLRRGAAQHRRELARRLNAAGLPVAVLNQGAAVAALYAERAAVRVEAAKAGGKGSDRAIDAHLESLDAAIRKAEDAGESIGEAMADVVSIEAALTAAGSELMRAEIESKSPPRVTLLQPAVAYDAE